MIGAPGPLIYSPHRPTAPANRGLIGHWVSLPQQRTRPLLWPDLSRGSRHNGTLTGFTAGGSHWRGDSQPGGYGSLAYDGTDDIVSLANGGDFTFSATTPWSVSCWIKTSTALATLIVSCWQGGVADGWMMMIGQGSAGTISGLMANAGFSAFRGRRGGTTVNNGAWHHVAVTYDGSNVNTGFLVFTDGIANTMTSLGNTAITPSSTNANIGNTNLVCSLNDVRIYNRWRTANEVAIEYFASKSRFTRELIRLPSNWYFTPTVTYTGTAAVTIKGATASGSATFTNPTYTGTGAATIKGATASGSAQVTNPTYTASAAVTIGAETASGSATFSPGTFTASAAVSIKGETASGSATFTAPVYTASGATTIKGVTAAGSATFVAPVYTGSANVTIAAATASGSATFAVPFVGSASVALAAAVASGSAMFTKPIYTGAAFPSIAPVIASGSATYTLPTITALAAVSIAPVIAAGVATFEYTLVEFAGLLVASPHLRGYIENIPRLVGTYLSDPASPSGHWGAGDN